MEGSSIHNLTHFLLCQKQKRLDKHKWRTYWYFIEWPFPCICHACDCMVLPQAATTKKPRLRHYLPRIWITWHNKRTTCDKRLSQADTWQWQRKKRSCYRQMCVIFRFRSLLFHLFFYSNFTVCKWPNHCQHVCSCASSYFFADLTTIETTVLTFQVKKTQV